MFVNHSCDQINLSSGFSYLKFPICKLLTGSINGENGADAKRKVKETGKGKLHLLHNSM